jgi:hypothetical protein
MDDFIARLQILLPVLGADFVRPTPQVHSSKAAKPTSIPPSQQNGIDGTQVQKYPLDAGTHPEFRMSAGGLQARAVEVDGQMMILAESDARSEEAPSLASNVRAYREQLRRAGKLRLAEGTGNLRFTEDVAFTSPSAAAQAVMGTSRNGRTDWINTATNETYAAWQDRQVAKAEAPLVEAAHEQPQ